MNAAIDYHSPHTAHRVPTPWLHRLAWLTCLATFPMIFMGGLVTSHGAGMSVPDWPNSYGYNMFTFPPNRWVGGIFYEHTHRLMGTVVGLCSMALVATAWFVERRRWARWTLTGVLGMVILQGVIGGLRVVWVNLDLAIVHACLAQAFFCLTAFAVLITSPRWPDVATRSKPVTSSRSLMAMGWVAFTCVYAQLIVGALMRHEGAGLAIPDIPLAYGRWLPPLSQSALQVVNQQRAWQFHLDAVTLGQVWLHFGHRIGATIVTIAATTLIAMILKRSRTVAGLAKDAFVLAGLLLLQLTLGLLTVYLRKPADIASSHVAVGALVLVTTFVFAVRATRRWMLERGAIQARDAAHFDNSAAVPQVLVTA